MIDFIHFNNGLELPIYRSEDLDEYISRDMLEGIIDWLDTADALVLQKYQGILMQKGDKVILPNKLELTFEAAGVYSLVFTFETPKGKLVIKMPNKFNEDEAQEQYIPNYTLEFARITQMQEELGDELKRYNVQLPKCVMAGTHVFIREYLEGEILDSSSKGDELSEAAGIVHSIEPLLLEWMEKKRKEKKNMNWENASLDLRDKIKRPSGKNFIKTENGEIFLIDPFIG